MFRFCEGKLVRGEVLNLSRKTGHCKTSCAEQEICSKEGI